MIKRINVRNKDLAKEFLRKIKDNDYVPFDIKVENSHIRDLNKLAGKIVFRKDTLYISSFTLWEIMQAVGSKGKHNYHGLTEDDILMALSSFKNPKYFFITKNYRYAIITTENSHFNIPLFVVIEIGAGTKENAKANIYKIVTIYPKDNYESVVKSLNKKDILYEANKK